MLIDITNLYKDKKVLVTGHTGFKGAWLSQALIELGAQVKGISLAPKNKDDLFNLIDLEQKMDSHIFDLRDRVQLEELITDYQPDFIFHLAAQALVLDSYSDPYNTMTTNLVSTLNILDILRKLNLPLVLVNVTSDKCYENNNTGLAFREEDSLGGIDPYSASKAMVEILSNSYNQSFFKKDSNVKMFTVRAGNVFGGGDWSANRLVPDIVRNIVAGEEIFLRNPNSYRPWQHVLEPISAYLQLAAYYYQKPDLPNESWDAWNIGPDLDSEVTVLDLVQRFIELWDEPEISFKFASAENKPYEAKTLGLSSEKIKSKLNWAPKLSFEDALKMTVDWYKACVNLDNMELLTRKQINDYFKKVNQTVS